MPQCHVRRAVYSRLRCTKQCAISAGWALAHTTAVTALHCALQVGTDFAHSTLLLQLCQCSRQVDYFGSLQHDGGGLAAAGLLLHAHTAGTLDCGPGLRPRGMCLCAYTNIIHLFIAVLFSR